MAVKRSSRNMMLVVAADDDIVLADMTCPACEDPFVGGMEVFLSVDENTAIHATCVTAMALVAALQSKDHAVVDALAEDNIQELLRVLGAE